ncbi:phosphoribosylamine--glycine ligase [Phosphitispora sp. TUW77]|uniref:phosphoribosylamine--glycine ligase n=1 Tax=Phosphitispora sp. TUW77 TaxID=3152361 RepID=UPI003AB91851
MKVLVVGGGGREHTLVWKLKQSPRVKEIYCAPGNAGISGEAACVDIAADDIDALLDFALEKGINLTVVGPEAPLSLGIVDRFREKGLRIFGPAQKAAEIEGSKVLAKEIMYKYNIPTAEYADFTDSDKAVEYIRKVGAPIVVKADGLAAGKGVIVAMDEQTAVDAVKSIMEERAFGDSGNRVVIEQFLEGEEVSILAFTDGTNVVPMVSSQDHKRIYDNDEGPNTGGMGAYSPAPVYTRDVEPFVYERVLLPTIQGMKEEGRTYEGVIYAGLMMTKDGPKVLEYNARFGDPETQAVLARLETDLVDIIDAVLEKRLADIEIKWSDNVAVCVVMASGGYPGSYEKGKVISGLNEAESEGAIVFHAGTAEKDGQIVSSGGRVLGVTALGSSIPEAIENVYRAVAKITWDGVQYRKDIGKKAIKHL